MKSVNRIEFAAGLFLILGIAALIFLALQATNADGLIGDDGYRIEARFSNVGGLKPRATVSMAGVKIGVVESVDLDPESLEARVVMRISSRYDMLPSDTSASILTAGLLGDQYIGLEPGGAPDVLQDGDRILITNSAVVLEQMIRRYLFNNEDGNPQ